MLNNVEDRITYLSQCKGVGRKQLTRWLNEDPSLKSILVRKPDELSERYKLQPDLIDLFLDPRNQENFLKKGEAYRRDNIETITILNADYPPQLRQIYDPPIVLYLKGDRRLLTHPRLLSVVGTRYPTINGKNSLRKILSPLIQKGWVIVSGLAYGIDLHSHEQAMRQSGKTIAVLGSGFRHIYPKEHIPISDEIASKHLLLSEYPPDVKPAKWQFPLRNRIISGLSRGTLIIEAREKSGSLITGDLALQDGREVFAVPGSILEPCSAGTNHLIQQGAKLTTCAEDILEELVDFTTNV
ncbi:DNA-processing protein DprA [Pseudalkalibacillus sp. Hm43]|uniref:DNA-processing protein DprA n=1 Tax=Pseudalkalibacillus sp. Hm43 TaxID=3450742 RepID=UPI003F43ACE3